MKECNKKSPKASDPNYICNPKTGRWVKKDGLLGKKIRSNKKSAKKSAKQKSPKVSVKKSAPKHSINHSKRILEEIGFKPSMSELKFFIDGDGKFMANKKVNTINYSIILFGVHKPESEVKKAVRRVLLRVHPDKYNGEYEYEASELVRFFNSHRMSFGNLPRRPIRRMYFRSNRK